MVRCLFVAAMAITLLANSAICQEKQVLELRTYTLVDAEAEKTLDAYLQHALLPALAKQGLGPCGVFDQAEEGLDGAIQVMLLIPGPNVEDVTAAAARLAADSDYQQAAHEYLGTPHDQPIFTRVQSELLLSFDCWPKVVVPKQKQTEQPRLFELRVYESPTERMGDRKVEMFNSGEVPIFLASNIRPVFMGQALIGDKLPNLTYMTVHDTADERKEAWKKFSSHPDWKALKSVEKYQGSVSKIHKSDWRPKDYSQL
jgi:hypothetical protein